MKVGIFERNRVVAADLAEAVQAHCQNCAIEISGNIEAGAAAPELVIIGDAPATIYAKCWLERALANGTAVVVFETSPVLALAVHGVEMLTLPFTDEAVKNALYRALGHGK